MGDMIWLGSVLAMAVFGYYVMLRLGTFLEKMQKEDEAQAKQSSCTWRHPSLRGRPLKNIPACSPDFWIPIRFLSPWGIRKK